MVPITDGEESLAFTTDGNRAAVKLLLQMLFDGQQIKSSWSDIVLIDILEPKPQQSFRKDLHLDYNPEKEAINLYTLEPYSVTIMHELMHSHLVGLRKFLL
jgi:hypothetical protein